MSNHKLRIAEIAELSKKYQVWKVHWVGEVGLKPNRSNEMLFEVCLVPLLNSQMFRGNRNVEHLVNNENYSFEERKIIRIGVGQLQLVSTGTVFDKGIPVKNPDYIISEFTFAAAKDKQNIISTADSWGKWGQTESEVTARYYIPATQYQVFLNSNIENTLPYPARCLVLNFSENERAKNTVSPDQYPLSLAPWKSERDPKDAATQISGERAGNQRAQVHGLIIPCMEMVRFYYTKSSPSCREILTGGLVGDPNRMYIPNDTRDVPQNGRKFLMLSRYVRNKDAPIIARYVFDEYTMRQALNIYTSTLNNQRLHGISYPDAKFPFQDSTTLKVHGTYIQSGNRIYFLVFRIASCMAPFPFDYLEYWRENPLRMKGEQTTTDVSKPEIVRTDDVETKGDKLTDYVEESDKKETKTARNAEGTDLQSESLPSDYRDRINLILADVGNRFPNLDIRKVKPHKPRPEGTEERPETEAELIFRNDKEEIETAGTGPRGDGHKITPVSFTPEDLDDAPEDLTELPEDPPEEEDVLIEELEDKEFDPADLELLYLTGDEEYFDEQLPEPDKGRKVNEDSLPIDLEIFREVLGGLKKSQPQLKIRMIRVPKVGEPKFTRTSTTFPSLWEAPYAETYRNKKNDTQPEIYIAEIKNKNGCYAYLMDIKTRQFSKRTIRSYRMFLCFAGIVPKKLNGGDLRYLLDDCLENNCTWMKSSSNRNKKLSYLVRKSFNHTPRFAQEYADRILEELSEKHWFSLNPTLDQETHEVSETFPD